MRKRGALIHTGRQGFSLLELLVTLAIMIVLLTLMYGKSSQVYQRQQKAACRENLQTLHVGLQLYANDHTEAYPSVAGATRSEVPLALLIPQYLNTTQPFLCPGTKLPPIPEGTPLTRSSISYAYYMGLRSVDSTQPLLSDTQVNTQPKLSGAILFSTDGKGLGNNHDRFGGNLLFVDGRTEETRPKSSLVLTQAAGVILLNPVP